MADRTFRDDAMADTQGGIYQTEHWLAYLFAVIAIVMGVIGLLVGFDVIASGGDEGTAVLERSNFWDGLLWMLGATSSAVLSYALHNSGHHLARSTDTLSSSQRSMFNGEHWLAWLMAIGSIVLAVIALFVGFDVFDNDNTVFDGILWMMGSVGLSALTVTLHSVRHHQMATDEDYIMSVVERHGTTPRTTGTMREPGVERQS